MAETQNAPAELDISCHKEAAVAAAGMPITHTHPHRCAKCGAVFTALNTFDDRPQRRAR